jgi:hypothetical protein
MKAAEAWLRGGGPFLSDRQIAIASKLAPTPGGGEHNICNTPNPCGSELAREYGGSACINVECADAFASKPACSVVFINTVCNTKPCGSEPAREGNDSVPAQNTPPKSPKIHSPTVLPYTVHQATHPCAFAYNYARIRPLVRLVPGLYCLPATAHQWSGLVARFTSRCMSLISQALPVLDGGCAHGTLGCAGFDVITGLLTCAQPPPFRLVARGLRPN